MNISISQRFIEQLYWSFFHRKPDAEGQAFWLGSLQSNRLSAVEITLAFAESRECIDFYHPIVRLYVSVLNRAPDKDGLLDWVQAYQNGLSLERIANAFIESSEFELHFGQLSNVDFLTLLYQNTLGRVPDALGLTGWLNQLAQGMSRANLILQINQSHEFEVARSSEINYILLHETILGKAADLTLIKKEMASKSIHNFIEALYAHPDYSGVDVPGLTRYSPPILRNEPRNNSESQPQPEPPDDSLGTANALTLTYEPLGHGSALAHSTVSGVLLLDINNFALAELHADRAIALDDISLQSALISSRLVVLSDDGERSNTSTQIVTFGTDGHDEVLLLDDGFELLTHYIFAGRGDDFIASGIGNDYLSGGDGHDVIAGGEGGDYILGGHGNDRLYGEDGDDTIFGGDGDDWIDGGTGNDVIRGGDGEDYIVSGFGSNDLDGGDGVDTIDYLQEFSGARDGEDAGVFGIAINLTPIEINLNDFIIGLAEPNETIFLSSSLDLGLANWHTLRFGAADENQFRILEGNSAAYLLSESSSIVGPRDTLSNFEIVNGSSLNDLIFTGNIFEVHAGSGNDIILNLGDEAFLSGEDGDDLIFSVGNYNKIIGGDGDDTLVVATNAEGLDHNSFSSMIAGGIGADLIYFLDPANEGSNTLIFYAYASDETNQGGSSDSFFGQEDGIYGLGSNDYFVLNLSNVRNFSFDRDISVESHVTGLTYSANTNFFDGEDGESLEEAGDIRVLVDGISESFDITELKNRTAVDLFGTDADDTLFGGFNDDTISGHDGNDFIAGGDGLDIIYLGAGFDTVLFGDDSSDEVHDFDFSIRGDKVAINLDHFNGLLQGRANNFSPALVAGGFLLGEDAPVLLSALLSNSSADLSDPPPLLGEDSTIFRVDENTPEDVTATLSAYSFAESMGFEPMNGDGLIVLWVDTEDHLRLSLATINVEGMLDGQFEVVSLTDIATFIGSYADALASLDAAHFEFISTGEDGWDPDEEEGPLTFAATLNPYGILSFEGNSQGDINFTVSSSGVMEFSREGIIAELTPSLTSVLEVSDFIWLSADVQNLSLENALALFGIDDVVPNGFIVTVKDTWTAIEGNLDTVAINGADSVVITEIPFSVALNVFGSDSPPPNNDKIVIEISDTWINLLWRLNPIDPLIARAQKVTVTDEVISLLSSDFIDLPPYVIFSGELEIETSESDLATLIAHPGFENIGTVYVSDLIILSVDEFNALPINVDIYWYEIEDEWSAIQAVLADPIIMQANYIYVSGNAELSALDLIELPMYVSFDMGFTVRDTWENLELALNNPNIYLAEHIYVTDIPAISTFEFLNLPFGLIFEMGYDISDDWGWIQPFLNHPMISDANEVYVSDPAFLYGYEVMVLSDNVTFMAGLAVDIAWADYYDLLLHPVFEYINYIYIFDTAYGSMGELNALSDKIDMSFFNYEIDDTWSEIRSYLMDPIIANASYVNVIDAAELSVSELSSLSVLTAYINFNHDLILRDTWANIVSGATNPSLRSPDAIYVIDLVAISADELSSLPIFPIFEAGLEITGSDQDNFVNSSLFIDPSLSLGLGVSADLLAGDDFFIGSAGNDIIRGGSGADELMGGTGNDIFAYDHQSDWSEDEIIADFGNESVNNLSFSNAPIIINGDVLQFSLSSLAVILNYQDLITVAPTGSNGSTLHTSDFVTDTVANGAHAQFIFYSQSTSLYFDPDGTGDTAPIAVVGTISYSGLTSGMIVLVA